MALPFVVAELTCCSAIFLAVVALRVRRVSSEPLDAYLSTVADLSALCAAGWDWPAQCGPGLLGTDMDRAAADPREARTVSARCRFLTCTVM